MTRADDKVSWVNFEVLSEGNWVMFFDDEGLKEAFLDVVEVPDEYGYEMSYLVICWLMAIQD